MGDLSAETFKELIAALQKSSVAMTSMSEKVGTLEKSIERLENGMTDLAGILKNGRLREILMILQNHDTRTNGYPEKCIMEITQNVEHSLKSNLTNVFQSSGFREAVSASIKEQLDPSDPGNHTPVIIKQQATQAAWQEWFNGKVFLVGGSLFGLFELVVKLLSSK